MTTRPTQSVPTTTSTSQPTDALAERLARLNQRRQPTGAVQAGAVGAGPNKPASRRHHPAQGARAAAFAMSFAATGGLVYYFSTASASQAQSQAFSALPAPLAVGPAPAAAPGTVPPATMTPATGAPATVPPATGAPTVPPATVPPATVPTATVPPAVAAFNGAVIATRYGPVQVQAQISNGVLADVAVVAYPNGDADSVDINRAALPRLRSAALSAQSAKIDTVSGATYTSDGYRKSLQSAIDQARAAGVSTLA